MPRIWLILEPEESFLDATGSHHTRGAWWQGYHNREIEALLDSSRVTIDPVEREALHRQSFAILRQDPSWLTLYNHVRTVALAGEHSDWAMRADGVLDVTLLPKFDLSD